MSLKRIFKEKIDIPFQEILKDIDANNVGMKCSFLKAKLAISPSNKMAFLYDLFFIQKMYSGFCFFPDEEVKTQFKKWGVPMPQLRWMISLDDIIKCFFEIETSLKITLLKKEILLGIQNHLHIKIRKQIFEWGQKTLRKNADFDLAHYYNLIFRRLKDGNGKLKSIKNEAEGQIAAIIMDIAKNFRSIDAAKNQFFRFLRGETEDSYLKTIVKSYYSEKEVTERQILIAFFDLFRIICKDEKLMNREGFKISTDKCIAKKVNPPYDGDYENYQYSKIKKLIFK